MKTIAVFEADDGTQFEDLEKCLEYESLCKDIEACMRNLPPYKELPHGTFRRLNEASCLTAKTTVVQTIRRRFGWKIFNGVPDDKWHPFSILGRYIDDSCYPCLKRAWGRLSRINWENFCEYDQPYFANHPDEAREDVST